MRFVYFILGGLVPLPIFFNLLSGEILLKREAENDYLTEFGVPLPIGMLSFSATWVVLIAKKLPNILVVGNLEKYISPLILIFCFSIYASLSIELFRVISLIVPIILLLFINQFPLHKTIFDASMKGYGASVLFLVISHAVSILYNYGFDTTSKIVAFNSYFGYIIYQSLVSYSAVLSFFGCILFMLILGRHWFITKWVSIISVFSVYFILSHGARKSVLLDLAILISSLTLTIITHYIKRQLVLKRFITALAVITFIFYLIITYTGFSEREVTMDVAVEQRGDAYEAFWNSITDGSLIDIIFGFRNDWGGYSNIILEFIASLGLVGLFLYVYLIYCLIKLVILNLQSVGFLEKKRNDRKYNQLRTFLVFVTVSLFAANLINMNLQLPYYSLNVIYLSLLFLSIIRGSPSV